jgi:MFS family permease
MLGSILAGVALRFWWLVAARAIQGLGMGSLQTLSVTILGDIVSPRSAAGIWDIWEACSVSP